MTLQRTDAHPVHCEKTCLYFPSGLDQLDWVTMDPRKARSIALAVCDISVDAPAYETVFRDAIDLVTQHATSFNFVELEALMNAMLKFMKRSPYLAHIPYFEAVANAAVRNNFTLFECGIILRRLNHLVSGGTTETSFGIPISLVDTRKISFGYVFCSRPS